VNVEKSLAVNSCDSDESWQRWMNAETTDEYFEATYTALLDQCFLYSIHPRSRQTTPDNGELSKATKCPKQAVRQAVRVSLMRRGGLPASQEKQGDDPTI
jgi:hypothetical protein